MSMNACQNAASQQISEFDISGLEAMLAGTLCLMSAYSHCPCNSNQPSSEQANNQGLIGLKIVSNLTCLQYQNNLSPEFRRVLSKVCETWRQHSLLAPAPDTQNATEKSEHASLWHLAPTAVQ